MLFAMYPPRLLLSSLLTSLLLVCASSCLPAQTQSAAPEVAPGLQIPNGSRPYVLDVFHDGKELVPMHTSAVVANKHKGANIAGGLLGGPFYKAKFTTEIAGVSARTVVHTATPTFYVQLTPPEDGGESMVAGWAIVHAAVDKDHRLLATVKFTQFTGSAKRNDSQVDVTVESLPGHWLAITPKSPLSPGEYAFLPVTKQENTFSTTVFDFRVDPAAENAADAILPRD